MELMTRRSIDCIVVLVMALAIYSVEAFLPSSQQYKQHYSHDSSSFVSTKRPLTSTTVSIPTRTTTLSMSDDEKVPPPTTFREAEVLGLKLMQEGNFEDALKAFQTGLRCPGSRPDVKRTKSLQGPSPVGGAMGGYESENVLTLDEFELQAAHYNMACAHAQLGNLNDAVANLEIAFQNGFDNYATVRGDPDLQAIRSTREFEDLMQNYDPKMKGLFGQRKNNKGTSGSGGGGFNPFGLFGGGGK